MTLWMTLLLASTSSARAGGDKPSKEALAEVEQLLRDAASDPTESNTKAANGAARKLRQQTDSSKHRVVGLLETYSLVLLYPWATFPFSVRSYEGNTEDDLKKARKHPFVEPTICGLRDIFHTEGEDRAVDDMEALADQYGATCGAPERIAKQTGETPAGTGVSTAASAKPPTEEGQSLTDELAAIMAAQGETYEQAAGYSACHEAETPADAVVACAALLDSTPDDIPTLTALTNAHESMAKAGGSGAYRHAFDAIQRLRQLRPLVDAGVQTAIDERIETLRPLTRKR